MQLRSSDLSEKDDILNGQVFVLDTLLFRIEDLEDSEEENIRFLAQNPRSVLDLCTRKTKTHYYTNANRIKTTA